MEVRDGIDAYYRSGGCTSHMHAFIVAMLDGLLDAKQKREANAGTETNAI